MLQAVLQSLIGWLAIPKIGLLSVFLVSFISATLIPMGSEPMVFATIKTGLYSFWLIILIASLGNTLGGMLNYGLGYAAKVSFASEKESRYLSWLQRFGAKTMLLSWLPVIGDPLCSLAGWLKLPFWPCALYMAIGKLLRYVCITLLLLRIPDGFWHDLAHWLS